MGVIGDDDSACAKEEGSAPERVWCFRVGEGVDSSPNAFASSSTALSSPASLYPLTASLPSLISSPSAALALPSTSTPTLASEACLVEDGAENDVEDDVEDELDDD